MIRPRKIPAQAGFEPGIFRSRGGRLTIRPKRRSISIDLLSRAVSRFAESWTPGFTETAVPVSLQSLPNDLSGEKKSTLYSSFNDAISTALDESPDFSYTKYLLNIPLLTRRTLISYTRIIDKISLRFQGDP